MVRGGVSMVHARKKGKPRHDAHLGDTATRAENQW